MALECTHLGLEQPSMDADFLPSAIGLPNHLASSLRPATPEDLDKNGDKIEQCHVCLDDFSSCSAPNKLLCGHIFGRRCILLAMYSQLGAATCPLCRMPCRPWPTDGESSPNPDEEEEEEDTLSDLDVDMDIVTDIGPVSIEAVLQPSDDEYGGSILAFLADDLAECMDVDECDDDQSYLDDQVADQHHPLDLTAD